MLKSQIAKNSFINLLGQVLPMTAGILCIPLLMKNIGLERFGILTIVWAVIGYFSLFDFGLSRVVTAKVSALRRDGQESRIPLIFWSSLRLILIFTFCGSFLLILLSFSSNYFANKASPSTIDEGLISLRLMAFTLPAITLTAGFKGLLEADHRFTELNLLQIIQGVLNFTIPLAISTINPSLVFIVFSLSLLRYLFFFFHIHLAFKLEANLKKIDFLPLAQTFPLLKEGGWISVTNIVGPVMMYFDRFFLAALLPAQNIAYYTTPFEMVSKILIVPAAITRTLFPTFAKNNDIVKTYQLYRQAVLTLTFFMALLIVASVPMSKFILKLWISNEFAENSSLILSILIVGFCVNAIAWIPFTLLQGVGRSDLTAKLHLVELPFYLMLLFALTTKFGLIGAAISWAIRSLVDLIALLFLAKKCFKIS